ncbi:MAG TPA: hypothetical protein VFZ37_21790 [Jiangellaceae bacterium]
MDHSRLRPAQVGASTAAAVGGAFLAARLGVYGTIIGVGVITLMGMVGTEILLRSLERSKQAARMANLRQRMAASTAAAPVVAPPADGADTLEVAVTEALPAAEAPAADTLEASALATEPRTAATGPLIAVDRPAASRPRRWPLVTAGFLASFALALAMITGIETFAGRSLAGDDDPTVVDVFRGAGQGTDDGPAIPATPTDEPTTSTQEDGGSTQPGSDAPAPNPAPADDAEAPQSDEETPLPDDDATPSDDATSPPADDAEPSDEEPDTTPAP